MKHLMIKAIACAVVLLPLQQLEAKNYGGFKPGQKFTLKVTKVISEKTDLNGKTTKAKIPASVPKYKKGQKIRCKIGKKGELIIPKKYQIKFQADGGNVNGYANKGTNKNPKADIANVYKKPNGKPSAAALTFFRTSGSGLKTASQMVFYELK